MKKSTTNLPLKASKKNLDTPPITPNNLSNKVNDRLNLNDNNINTTPLRSVKRKLPLSDSRGDSNASSLNFNTSDNNNLNNSDKRQLSKQLNQQAENLTRNAENIVNNPDDPFLKAYKQIINETKTDVLSIYDIDTNDIFDDNTPYGTPTQASQLNSQQLAVTVPPLNIPVSNQNTNNTLINSDDGTSDPVPPSIEEKKESPRVIEELSQLQIKTYYYTIARALHYYEALHGTFLAKELQIQEKKPSRWIKVYDEFIQKLLEIYADNNLSLSVKRARLASLIRLTQVKLENQIKLEAVPRTSHRIANCLRSLSANLEDDVESNIRGKEYYIKENVDNFIQVHEISRAQQQITPLKKLVNNSVERTAYKRIQLTLKLLLRAFAKQKTTVSSLLDQLPPMTPIKPAQNHHANVGTFSPFNASQTDTESFTSSPFSPVHPKLNESDPTSIETLLNNPPIKIFRDHKIFLVETLNTLKYSGLNQAKTENFFIQKTLENICIDLKIPGFHTREKLSDEETIYQEKILSCIQIINHYVIKKATRFTDHEKIAHAHVVRQDLIRLLNPDKRKALNITSLYDLCQIIDGLLHIRQLNVLVKFQSLHKYDRLAAPKFLFDDNYSQMLDALSDNLIVSLEEEPEQIIGKRKNELQRLATEAPNDMSEEIAAALNQPAIELVKKQQGLDLSDISSRYRLYQYIDFYDKKNTLPKNQKPNFTSFKERLLDHFRNEIQPKTAQYVEEIIPEDRSTYDAKNQAENATRLTKIALLLNLNNNLHPGEEHQYSSALGIYRAIIGGRIKPLMGWLKNHFDYLLRQDPPSFYEASLCIQILKDIINNQEIRSLVNNYVATIEHRIEQQSLLLKEKLPQKATYGYGKLDEVYARWVISGVIKNKVALNRAIADQIEQDLSGESYKKYINNMLENNSDETKNYISSAVIDKQIRECNDKETFLIALQQDNQGSNDIINDDDDDQIVISEDKNNPVYNSQPQQIQPVNMQKAQHYAFLSAYFSLKKRAINKAVDSLITKKEYDLLISGKEYILNQEANNQNNNDGSYCGNNAAIVEVESSCRVTELDAKIDTLCVSNALFKKYYDVEFERAKNYAPSILNQRYEKERAKFALWTEKEKLHKEVNDKNSFIKILSDLVETLYYSLSLSIKKIFSPNTLDRSAVSNEVSHEQSTNPFTYNNYESDKDGSELDAFSEFSENEQQEEDRDIINQVQQETINHRPAVSKQLRHNIFQLFSRPQLGEENKPNFIKPSLAISRPPSKI